MKISERALISVNGKAAIVVQSDGRPGLLGMELLRGDKTIKGIFQVAREHLIEATDKIGIIELEKGEGYRSAGSKRQSLPSKVVLKAIKRRTEIMCADDFEIYGIDSFGDWIHYRYDIRGKEIYFRVLPK